MKILHIIEIRGIGGAENLLLDFLPAQVKIGEEVSCLILYMSAYKKDAVNIGRILELNKINVCFIEFQSNILFARAIFKVHKHIKSINPNVIHTHLRIAELIVVFLKKLSLKIPITTTIHGFADSKRYFKLRLFAVKNLLRNFNGLVFISDFIFEFYRNHYLISPSNTTHIIHNGYNIANSPQSNNDYLIKKDIKIISPGRLTELKGHKYAIEAIKELTHKYPKIQLHIYGSGPCEQNIRKMIDDTALENNILLCGFSDDIKLLLPTFDIVLVPSLFESFGMVFLDAFAAKVPVVAFDLPAGNEIITDEYNGLLAKPYSSTSLAEKIELIISNNQLRKSIIDNSTQVLNAKFTIEKMAVNYILFYKKIIGAMKSN
jgi:glycosyltransferase involved in cell wall biosynthesis